MTALSSDDQHDAEVDVADEERVDGEHQAVHHRSPPGRR